MLVILLILSAGIILGHFLQSKRKVINISNRLLLLSIFLLLFLLGTEVGTNQTIIANFAEIGFKAIIISLSGILSSVALSYFVYRYFFRKNHEE